MKTLKTITLIGSGNVASHIGLSFVKNGFLVKEVYSKTITNAEALATKLNGIALDDIQKLNDKSDIYIVCIKDDIIENLLKKIPFRNKLIVHTSGNVSIDVFKTNGFTNYGIFYPLQTFSKDREINLEEVPICIEGSNEYEGNCLTNLAKTISKKVFSFDSESRKKIHLAAVFANNFSNFMYTISSDLLKKNNINFSILEPLIAETANKIVSNEPKNVQTGPAIRKDNLVIENHLKMLADFEEYRDIYQLITNTIIKEN